MNSPNSQAIETLLQGATDPARRSTIINAMINRAEKTSITDARDRMLLRILKAIALELRDSADSSSSVSSGNGSLRGSNGSSTASSGNGSFETSRGSNGSSTASSGNGSFETSRGSNGSSTASSGNGSSTASSGNGSSTASSGNGSFATSRGSNGSFETSRGSNGSSTTSSGNGAFETSRGSNGSFETSRGSNGSASSGNGSSSESSGSNGAFETSRRSNGSSTASSGNGSATTNGLGTAASSGTAAPQFPDGTPQTQIATTTAILNNLKQNGGALNPVLMPYFYTITRRLNGNLRQFLAGSAEVYQPQKQKHSRKFMFTQFNAALEVLAALKLNMIDRIVFGKELSSDAQRSTQAATFISNPTPFELKDVAPYDRKLQFLANWNVYNADTTFLPKGQRQQFGGTRRRRQMSRRRRIMN